MEIKLNISEKSNIYTYKLTTSSISSYSFSNLTFFYEISCSTCHKFVFRQQNCKIGLCKNKNSPNVNIQKYVESKIIIQAQIQTSN